MYKLKKPGMGTSFKCTIQRFKSTFIPEPTSRPTSKNKNAWGIGLNAVSYDFRSDTVTLPTPEMLAYMAKAPVGDDVFKEDASVNQLESHVANLLGKPAALFVTSGTLANQLAIQAHLALNGGGPPHSVIVDSRAHVYCWEAGAIAANTGAHVIPIAVGKRQDYPYLTALDIKQYAIPQADDHCAPTRLVCLENPLDGAIMPINEINQIAATSQTMGIRVHMDGARIWHASVESQIPLHQITKAMDSVSVCLSKGTGAPVGSILVGSKEFIARAQHLRKMYGGGWRQAGLLAACAQYALNKTYPDELLRTHYEARRLASGLVARKAIILNPLVETNMVFVDWSSHGWTCDTFVSAARKYSQDHLPPIRVFGGNSSVMRLVLHYQLAPDAVDKFLKLVDQMGLSPVKSISSSESKLYL